jgi:hypothetical protein
MPNLTEASLKNWRIIYLPDSEQSFAREEIVRALYPVGDGGLPGWTLLKDHEHQIVKMIRDDRVQSIERLPAEEIG